MLLFELCPSARVLRHLGSNSNLGFPPHGGGKMPPLGAPLTRAADIQIAKSLRGSSVLEVHFCYVSFSNVSCQTVDPRSRRHWERSAQPLFCSSAIMGKKARLSSRKGQKVSPNVSKITKINAAVKAVAKGVAKKEAAKSAGISRCL